MNSGPSVRPARYSSCPLRFIEPFRTSLRHTLQIRLSVCPVPPSAGREGWKMRIVLMVCTMLIATIFSTVAHAKHDSVELPSAESRDRSSSSSPQKSAASIETERADDCDRESHLAIPRAASIVRLIRPAQAARDAQCPIPEVPAHSPEQETIP